MKKTFLNQRSQYASPAIVEIAIATEQVFAASLEATHEGFDYAYDYDEE